MDHISLVYNINICRICQNPQSLELFDTKNINNLIYVQLVNSLFSHIVWVEDEIASHLCKSCSAKLDSFVEFKTLCLETSERRRQYIVKLSGIENTDDVSIKDEVKPELVVLAELGKLYQCTSCPESFDKNLELRKHERKVHGSSNTPVKKGTKRISSSAKRASVSKRPRKVKRILDSDDEEPREERKPRKVRKVKKKVDLDEVNGDSDLGGDDNDDCDDPSLETDPNQTDLPESSPNLYYKPTKGETTCRICSRSFTIMQRLKNHINNVHVRRILHRCSVCKAGFTNKEKLNRHEKHHTGERNHICPTCGAKFITSNDLWTHLQTHLTVRNYKCDKCEKCFKTSGSLRIHKTVVHTDPSEYKFICTECGIKFPVKCSLTSHMLRHTTTKKIKCHICPKEFFTNGELKNHLVCHTNVRKHKCDLCPEEFKQKQSLDKHKSRKHQIGTITPRKKLPCGFCGRLITSGEKLRRHERTHTGEKPYKCRLCDMRFICRSYIKGHLRGKHEIDVEVFDFDQRAYYESSPEEEVPDLRTVTQGKSRRAANKDSSYIPLPLEQQC